MARREATKQSRARGLPLGDCFAALAMTTPHVQADRLLAQEQKFCLRFFFPFAFVLRRREKVHQVRLQRTLQLSPA
jgi:hypothetical protein